MKEVLKFRTVGDSFAIISLDDVKHVSFQESDNKRYKTKIVVTYNNEYEVWYSETELKEFHRVIF